MRGKTPVRGDRGERTEGSKGGDVDGAESTWKEVKTPALKKRTASPARSRSKSASKRNVSITSPSVTRSSKKKTPIKDESSNEQLDVITHKKGLKDQVEVSDSNNNNDTSNVSISTKKSQLNQARIGVSLSLFLFCGVFIAMMWILINGKIVDRGICEKDSDDFQVATSQLAQIVSSDIDYSSFKGECFFSNDYYEARSLFLNCSTLAKAELRALPVYNGLSTDVAILWGRPDKFLVHISGTHGPEGFAGSSIQSAALQYLASKKVYDDRRNAMKKLPTIVFVHALNPYGFANNRRFNEDNVDLNRNFLKDEEFKALKIRDPNFAGYTDIEFMINPKSMPTPFIWINDIHSLLVSAYAIATVGLQKIKKGMVSGNYYKQEGLYFGGFKKSTSVLNLIRLVRDLGIPNQAKQVVLIDVHSGLGPSGVDTITLDSTNSSNTPSYVAEMEKYFPTEYDNHDAETKNNIKKNKVTGGIKGSISGSDDGALSGYDLTVGTVTEDFCNNWLAPKLGDFSRVCITQEFGTVPMVKVGTDMRAENYAHHYGSEVEKRIYGERVKDSFYVQTKSWKRNIMRRGFKLFMQSFEYLNVEQIPSISTTSSSSASTSTSTSSTSSTAATTATTTPDSSSPSSSSSSSHITTPPSPPLTTSTKSASNAQDIGMNGVGTSF